MKKVYQSHRPEDTWSVAAQVGAHLSAGDFVALEGDLGSGKTCFVQGLCRALGYDDGVRSPTFVLLQQHRVGGRIGVLHHFDLYRLEQPAQLDDIGYEEFFHGDGVCLVEWPQRAGDRLPPDRLIVHLAHGVAPDDRTITVTALGQRSEQVLRSL